MFKTISILLKFSNLGKIVMGLSPSKYYMTIKIPKLKISGRTQETKKHIALHKIMFFHVVKSTQFFIKCETHPP